MYIPYATLDTLIYLFFDKRLPWIRVPLLFFRFFKSLSEMVIIDPKLIRYLSVYSRSQILHLLASQYLSYLNQFIFLLFLFWKLK